MEQEAYDGELKYLRQIRQAFRHIIAEKLPDVYFISGESTDDKDQNGLPGTIYICPAYGVDWVVAYKRQP